MCVVQKKQELARKVAETEERRKAEEQARQQRLADEQRRADNNRRKQMEEAEAMKKEAAIMAKEIEKRQKEYIEKQKLKHRLEMEKLRTPGTPGRCLLVTEPTYMADGFQHLNSDEDEEPEDRPVPNWSTSKVFIFCGELRDSCDNKLMHVMKKVTLNLCISTANR
ncbi:unnamed protein product [Diatraea saccharalis]|uniref:Uncharacterized protein n=1 Tax=Diatraea saccharalis TaxID=40085 RepID=A0A9N9RAA9_9NEOP|nr:unnamed protein product [Diatraea saccharalis]